MSIAPVPFFPVPPPQYTQQYMAEVVRAFSVFATQITNPAIAKPILIEIPASSLSGDEVGTVYESNTVLRLKSATAAKNTSTGRWRYDRDAQAYLGCGRGHHIRPA